MTEPRSNEHQGDAAHQPADGETHDAAGRPEVSMDDESLLMEITRRLEQAAIERELDLRALMARTPHRATQDESLAFRHLRPLWPDSAPPIARRRRAVPALLAAASVTLAVWGLWPQAHPDTPNTVSDAVVGTLGSRMQFTGLDSSVPWEQLSWTAPFTEREGGYRVTVNPANAHSFAVDVSTPSWRPTETQRSAMRGRTFVRVEAIRHGERRAIASIESWFDGAP